MTSYSEFLHLTRAAISEIEPAALDAQLDRVVLIDVRETDEFASGTIPGSVLVPRGTLEGAISEVAPDLGAEIVLVCTVGARSALAARTLGEMGYTRVHSLAGGTVRWRQEGRRWSQPSSLTADQRGRYDRHLRLAGVGEAGQAALLDASVVVIGAGGLGSPAVLYLAAAGVGTIGIVDFDTVDASNLQRQVLHSTDRLGMAKVDSAREVVTRLNPDVKVETYPDRLSAANALGILAGYDVILDGADNFPTRYLVNDASLHLRIPVVHGSIFRFEGQVSVFDPYVTGCYRCLFPLPPAPELAPNCAEAGVFGVLPGVIGSIQATETLKLLLGLGEPLAGRLLIYDALAEDFATVTLPRQVDCAACADPESPPRLVDYDLTCIPAGNVARH